MDIFSPLFAVLFILSTILLSLIILVSLHWREKTGEGQVQVVVLGDIGRSPRIQYHCLSLIEQKYDVELIGYGGTYMCLSIIIIFILSHLGQS